MAVDMFLNIEDKKIKGESRDKTHKETIDVLAWSWGLSQSGTMHQGGGGGAGKVSVQDLSITKYLDRSSPDLEKACCQGTHFKNAKLIVRKAGGSPLEYLIINMEGVLVSSVSTGGNTGDDRLTESITLNFAKVKVQYQPQKEDGAKDGGVVEMGWNIAENVPF
ncbi:MAG: type VI secretion system tube protein Hcp [Planctomycetota bacterium]